VLLPGLIDPHVHLREPGGTHKEDFDTGTAAALAGGFTTVLAMPNTNPPLIDRPTLTLAKTAARAKARCDYGLYLGAGYDNVSAAQELAPSVCGLKMYLDQTHGPVLLETLNDIRHHFANWPKPRPIAVHAEGRSMATVLLFAMLQDRSVHVCHVSRKEEIELIRAAKERGIKVTCEVTPHHLFLTEQDNPSLGPGRCEVRPRLASAADRDALWANLDVIDCFATDHAPHTLAEKDGDTPPPGFPGLETALSLMLTAVYERRISMDDLILRMHANPKRIFGLPDQAQTEIEVDTEAVWEVRAQEMHSRCGWSPYDGARLRGRVRKVTLRGQTVYEDGHVLSMPGYGIDLVSASREIQV
jgi:carbamoyl-phosphate synthase/aspartate carbamoyltransferase/dihydroorotase